MYIQDYLASQHRQGGEGDSSSRSSRHSRTLAVGMDGTVNHHEHMNIVGLHGTSSEDRYVQSSGDSSLASGTREETFLIMDADEISLQKSENKKKKRCILCSTFILLVAFVAAMAPLAAKRANETRSSRAAFAQIGECQAGIIQEMKESQLELYMSGINTVAEEDKIPLMEAAVISSFNDVSRGCADKYQRWMYGATLSSQEIIRDLIFTEQATNLETLFIEKWTLVARFQTNISCAGCLDEEAFASVYPPNFGGPIFGRSQKQGGQRALEEISTTFKDDEPRVLVQRNEVALDAAEIVMEMERTMKTILPDLTGFQEVTIMSTRVDGSIAATTMYENREEVTAYQPSFFRNKAVRDIQTLGDCDDGPGLRQGKSSKGTKSLPAPPVTPAPTSLPTLQQTPPPSEVTIGKKGVSETGKKGDSTVAPAEGKKASSDTGKKGTAAPIEGKKGTAAPTEGKKGASATGKKGTAAPAEGKKGFSTAAPAEGKKGASATGKKGTAAPAEGKKGSSTAAPAEGKKGDVSGKKSCSESEEIDEDVSSVGTSEELGSNPVCNVCGQGKRMTNPAGTFFPPGMRETQCAALQQAGANGIIPADSCPLIPSLIEVPCQCV